MNSFFRQDSTNESRMVASICLRYMLQLLQLGNTKGNVLKIMVINFRFPYNFRWVGAGPSSLEHIPVQALFGNTQILLPLNSITLGCPMYGDRGIKIWIGEMFNESQIGTTTPSIGLNRFPCSVIVISSYYIMLVFLLGGQFPSSFSFMERLSFSLRHQKMLMFPSTTNYQSS